MIDSRFFYCVWIWVTVNILAVSCCMNYCKLTFWMLSTYLVHNILTTWQELADDVLLMLLYSYLFLYTWTVQLSVMKTWLIMNYYVYMYYYTTHVICVYCNCYRIFSTSIKPFFWITRSTMLVSWKYFSAYYLG